MRDFRNIEDWRLYLVTDVKLSGGRSHEEITRLAIAGGVDVIQLRDKTASSRELFEVGMIMRRLTREAKVAFIVNDRIDIALAVDADGVHIGQSDMPVDVARRFIGMDRILGVSIGSVEEARQAEQAGADLLSVSPVFEARSSKPDAGEPHGLRLIRETKLACSKPVMAIGGINGDNVAAVIQAGSCCASVITAVLQAEDIPSAVWEMTKIIETAKSLEGKP